MAGSFYGCVETAWISQKAAADPVRVVLVLRSILGDIWEAVLLDRDKFTYKDL